MEDLGADDKIWAQLPIFRKNKIFFNTVQYGKKHGIAKYLRFFVKFRMMGCMRPRF